jgi:LmbE family N-acetylglucosaminyl deacetylase
VARLTLISDTADRELDAIRRTVERFEQISGVEGLIANLRDHARSETQVATLDLVGHSRGHGFLVLGRWTIDDSPQVAATFGQELRAALDVLGVREIRLLGCSTATTERSFAALRRISHSVRRMVLGTRRYISKNDYGPSGFISDDTLVEANGTKRQRDDRVGFLNATATAVSINAIELTAGPKLTNELPLLPVNEAVAAKILTFVDGARSWVLPGLLAEPAPIILWSHANAIHRFDVLLDHQVIRAYGSYPDDDHGRLFRVRDPDGLSRYLDALQGRNETPSHTT